MVLLITSESGRATPRRADIVAGGGAKPEAGPATSGGIILKAG